MREHSGIFLFDPREPEEDAGSKGSIHLHFNLSIANRNIPDHKQHTGEIYQVFEFLGIQISLVLPFATQEPSELITRQQLVCSLEFPSRIQPTTEVFETADKAQLSDHIVNLPVLQVEILPFARIELHAARHTLQPFLPDLDTTETEQKVSADLSVAIEVGTDEIQHITQLILGQFAPGSRTLQMKHLIRRSETRCPLFYSHTVRSDCIHKQSCWHRC